MMSIFKSLTMSPEQRGLAASRGHLERAAGGLMREARS
jgi:hypothetical protein